MLTYIKLFNQNEFVIGLNSNDEMEESYKFNSLREALLYSTDFKINILYSK